MSRYYRALTALFFLLLAIAAARDFARLGPALPWRTMDDFPDFYCAGWVLDRGANPYTYEPLRTCEHAVNTGAGFRARVFTSNPALAVPAPQPPYDFSAFMPLAYTSFPLARAIDAAAILVAVALCVLALAGLGVRWILALAVFGLSAAYADLNTGQIVPFALLALICCGLALDRRRDAVAGVLAGLCAIEPAMALPVIVAMFWFVPRARWSLALTLAGLAMIAGALVGPTGVTLYLAKVLPAHAGSELRFPFQYSMTYVLASLGAAPGMAGLAGAASYVLFAAPGIWLAGRTSAAVQRRELVVFVPALGSVIFGAFVHQEELIFAIPAVTTIALTGSGATRAIGAICLGILAIPWIDVWGSKQLFLMSLLVLATILAQLRTGFRAALAGFIGIGGLLYAFELHPPNLPVPAAMPAIYAAGDLVQREWRDYTTARSTNDPLWYAIKIPAWAALLTALALVARVRTRIPDAPAPAAESHGS